MLKYELAQHVGDEITYNYFPEGEDAFGVIAYNETLGTCTVRKLAENDPHQLYAAKMMKRIREFSSNRNYLNEGIIAWY